MNKKFKILFSRHAKRRIKLYKLTSKSIAEGIKASFQNQDKPLLNSKREIIFPDKLKKSVYKLKAVLIVKHFDIIVVTVYPIKKVR